MRTTVQISPGLDRALDDWHRTLSPDPVMAEQMGAALLAALFRRLESTDGVPPDGFIDRTVRPREYWYELSGGTWAVYTITDGRYLFTRWREVAIVGLAPARPSRAVPTSPKA